MPANRRPNAEALRQANLVAMLLLGFSIAVSTSLTNILVIVIGGLWLIGGDLRWKWHCIRANPVAWLPLALFAWLLAGVWYTSIESLDSLRGALKYRELLYIPIFLTLNSSPTTRLGRLADVLDAIRLRSWHIADTRTWCLAGFIAGALVELAASYAEWLFGVDWGFPTTTDHVVFKDRIIHNFLLAFVLFVLAHEFQAVSSRRWRAGIVLTGGLTIINMLTMVQGRTGYLAIVVLTAVFMVQRFGTRGVAYAAAAVVMLAATAYGSSATFRFRVHESFLQVQSSLGRPAAPVDSRMTAEEPRLKFYAQAIDLVRRRPVLGGGAGSFEHELRQLLNDANATITDDPHNEYLAIATQSGLIGLALWLAILIAQWRDFQRLDDFDRHLAHGMLALMASGCLVNSLLMGFTGGVFWAYFSAVLAAPLVTSRTSSRADSSPELGQIALPDRLAA
jgi:O-antigen ligase